MQGNITFSLYKIKDIKNIKVIYEKLQTKNKTIKEEKGNYYSTIIKKKTKIFNWEFQNKKYQYFSISASIERPNRSGGKSEKKAEILFYINSNDEIYVLPIFKELQTHIIMRNILSDEIKYDFYQIIPKEKKALFISWLYSHEENKTLSLEKEFSLKNIKAYKCVTDDKKGTFKGKSESTICEYLEPMQVIIFNYDFNYLKLSILYKTNKYELVISFNDGDNYKVFYNDTMFEGTLFLELLDEEKLIIFVTNVVIPELYLAFLESSWNEQELLNQNLNLVNIIISSMNMKKEEIEEAIDDLKKGKGKLKIKKEEEKALLPLFKN